MSMSKNYGRQRVTIEDVAKQAGVSTATVSRVLNKTGNIGIILPAISNPFLTSLLESINQYASANGYNLLIYATTIQASIRGGVPIPLNEDNTDGLLIFSNSVDDRTLFYLHRRQFPMVMLYRKPPQDLEIPCVLLENKHGARTLIEHLIKSCGHRRIAFMAGPPENQDSYWREQGYREALAANNIPFDPNLMGTGAFHDWKAKEQVEQWLAQSLEIDAIFAGDDTAAMAAIVALQQAGKRVPEDIAVVGFNNDTLSEYINPPLTTVHAPTGAIGRMAAKQLFHLIRGEPTEKISLFKTEIVIRQSCGYHLAVKSNIEAEARP